jgi:hypothetical protein
MTDREYDAAASPLGDTMPNEPKTGLLPPSTYVNFLRVANNQSEFFLSFGQLVQEQGVGAHLVSSLVTSPAHAKAMLRALEDAVERHEQRFGEIAVVEPPTPVPAAVGDAPAGLRPAASGDAGRTKSTPPPRGIRTKAKSA